MNDGGLTCDLNALIFPWTKYPGNSSTLDNLGVGYICQWALEGFESVRELEQGLEHVHFFGDVDFGAHWALRDAQRHLQWKQSLARPAVTMPGAWYPDERFQRIHLVKSSMPKPKSYEEAVMQAVHALNTITVPMGFQLGT